MVCALIPLTMIMQVFFGNFKSIAHNVLPEVFVGEDSIVNRVFVTSTKYNGNLGGTSGADSKCQESANNANLGGTWKAWLTVASTIDVASTFIQSTNPYVLVDGTTIASNWRDLTDQNLSVPIDKDEFGNTVTDIMDYINVWTNTWTSGHIYDTQPNLTCNNFSAAYSTQTGQGGATTKANYEWTSYANRQRKCNTTARLYCFEQVSNSPIPTPTPDLVSYHRVFVTSDTFNANLGGLDGADSMCQTRASASNLGGEWKAWLSDSKISASSRMLHSGHPYKRIDGVIIANNWDDLIDGSIQNPIQVDEKGNILNLGYFYAKVWTNTTTAGEIRDSYLSCNNWTSGSYLTGDGLGGVLMNKDSQWTEDGSDPCSVTNTNRLYCIEQSLFTPSSTPVPTVNASPTPYVKPTTAPTPKPKPNSKPKITTNSLPWAYIGRTYNAIIEGTDVDSNDTLNMTITGLPDFLSAGSCKQIKDSKKQNVVYSCSITSNGAIKLTYTKTYQVNVTLTDNRGGKDIKTLPLRVYTSIKPVVTKYPIPTIRP
ncbi:hypothetical protein COX08_03175 [Candidatus Beckwithbacteria bacterium CG23_combo_of_CG06-09_8_20_14_all_34_8]|uniref:DUF1554 domain-containing protein n=1 Tax=Candidatus Beckwithbacteria bacterium CG23_combo_of_CG06-09_8_20_14_all_34_8 TaxID=1974497 RepID=A0A2H0B5W6_9BACT|nr:MAG: hypothetical protein COX08_03175 [Candidatus Beckwithbacteria bacterium CG23_combo_of_CG06-09_8_20_14_all_34_8]